MKEVCEQELSVADSFAVLNKRVHDEFVSIKEELDEHLLAVNENTKDIEQHDSILTVLDDKVEKLNLRMDTIQRMFRSFIMQTRVRVDLSMNEQKLFVLLVEFGKYIPASYASEKIVLSFEDLEDCITSLCDKGIPVEKRVIGDKAYLKIDEDFRKLQQHEPIVHISPFVLQQMENKVLASFF